MGNDVHKGEGSKVSTTGTPDHDGITTEVGSKADSLACLQVLGILDENLGILGNQADGVLCYLSCPFIGFLLGTTEHFKRVCDGIESPIDSH